MASQFVSQDSQILKANSKMLQLRTFQRIMTHQASLIHGLKGDFQKVERQISKSKVQRGKQ